MKFSLLDILLICLAIGGVLVSIRTNQLGPHHIKTVIGNRVISETVTTNPAYVTFLHRTNITSAGITFTAVPVTNYHWKIWSIWK